ncbi:hypothetical protein [Streptomyces sp. NPDC051001]|uniref:hypothetical protein n=1 Tax=Streptomyces sp. NPDC051001 TaxID=3155795 RepID=UPI003440EC4A
MQNKLSASTNGWAGVPPSDPALFLDARGRDSSKAPPAARAEGFSGHATEATKHQKSGRAGWLSTERQQSTDYA